MNKKNERRALDAATKVLVDKDEWERGKKDTARLDRILHDCTYAANPEMSVKIHWGLSNAGRSTIDNYAAASSQAKPPQ